MKTTHKTDFLNRAHDFVIINGASGVRKILDGVRYRKNTQRVDANLPTIHQAAQWLRSDKRFSRTLTRHASNHQTGGAYKVMVYGSLEVEE